ncbi:MAG: hypothetical protein ACTHMS_02365 [Jatrophihabitans sp.]|uniref:hypothetical protein n=1 Tax=Jatrophihabitans sp. TaxID=1932789 RepID=UPI003F808758
MSEPAVSPPTATDFISYGEWGELFFRAAVTEQRVLGAVATVAGQPIDFGPTKVDPIGLIKVSASGRVGTPELAQRDEALVVFDLVIPVTLALLLDLGLDKHRFNADVHVRLVLTARAARPLQIVIDIEPPHGRDVSVDLRAEALRSSVLQVLAGIEGELRRQVARFVRKELEKPALQQARVIDVGAAIAALRLPRA